MIDNAVLSLTAHVFGEDLTFRYVNGNNTIQIGVTLYPMHSGGQPSFVQSNTIQLDPATRKALTLAAFEDIALEWIEDEIAARELVGY